MIIEKRALSIKPIDIGFLNLLTMQFFSLEKVIGEMTNGGVQYFAFMQLDYLLGID